MRFALSSLSVLTLLFISSATYASERDGPQEADALRKSARITVLYDAFGQNPRLQKDWGYAALVEIGGHRILFDTGNDPVTFEHNVKALDIDLRTLDFVVLSHRHGDHTSGLTYLLSVNPKVPIYAPKENFGVFGSSLPGTFYRKDRSLPKERRYFDGSPPDTIFSGNAWPGAHITLIDKTTEVAPGIHLIALVSDKPGTLELKELSLAIETAQGIVLIVGCSHPGIERIVTAAMSIDRRIHLLAGGLHLVSTADTEIARLIGALRDTYGVAWIAAGHCTGEPAFSTLTRRFGDHSLYAGVGTTIGLGTNPRADLSSASRFAVSEEDYLTYRSVMRRHLVRFGSRGNFR